VGEVKISHKQARNLGLNRKTPVSPGLEKCCLRACAKTSYEQAAEDIEQMMGIKVGHSTLHRMVARVELPPAQAQQASEGMSVDGGKVCLRTAEGGQWRDYKLISLHGSVCEAFFQDPQALKAWYDQQPKAIMLTCLGDGHDGIWNVIHELAATVPIQRQVLDWYHLVENLYKVGGSLKRLALVENYLWHGWVDSAIAAFDGLRSRQAQNFQNYLRKHQERIPWYGQYQQLGIPIGSGDVESRIKQMGARVKLPGARWLPQNVPRILRLRCAYLNRSDALSISTYP
jgi:hypothetical protein